MVITMQCISAILLPFLKFVFHDWHSSLVLNWNYACRIIFCLDVQSWSCRMLWLRTKSYKMVITCASRAKLRLKPISLVKCVSGTEPRHWFSMITNFWDFLKKRYHNQPDIWNSCCDGTVLKHWPRPQSFCGMIGDCTEPSLRVCESLWACIRHQ